MQPTTPPRLSSDPSAQPGYAPIAWAAVAALALASLFVVVLAYLGIASYRKGLPLTDTWIPFVPALVVVLAFIARRQIRASEGTRTGEQYANAAWWMAVVSGVAFLAYLQGYKYTVQQDARRTFNSWADNLRELDAFNPKDPNVTEAAWLLIPPGTRPASKKDAARIEQAFGDVVAGFRQMDVVRVCQRNHGKLTLAAQGLKEWTVRTGEIECVLAASIDCPEGEYLMDLPLRAAVDDRGVRRWQLKPPGQEGFVKSRNLTRTGWEAAALEADGAAVANSMLLLSRQANQHPVLYLGFVQSGGQPAQAIQTLNQFTYAADPLGALTGATSLPAVRGDLLPRDRQPLPAGWYDNLSQNVFAKPDGTPHNPADVERLWRIWSTGGQIAPAGTILKKSMDLNGVLAIGADAIEYRVPVELATGLGGTVPSAFKGRLVFRLPSDAAAPVLAARAAASPSDPRTSQPPADFTLTRRPWRLVRLETDLKPVQGELPRQSPGG